MYYVTIFLVVGLETACMLRFFFLVDTEWAYSTSCMILTLFFFFTDIAVFWSLTKAKREDPGYLIPSSRLNSSSEVLVNADDDTNMVCKKCGVKKTNQ